MVESFITAVEVFFFCWWVLLPGKTILQSGFLQRGKTRYQTLINHCVRTFAFFVLSVGDRNFGKGKTFPDRGRPPRQNAPKHTMPDTGKVTLPLTESLAGTC